MGLLVVAPEAQHLHDLLLLQHLVLEAVLQGFEPSLAPRLLVLVLELERQDSLNANACLRGWTTTL